MSDPNDFQCDICGNTLTVFVKTVKCGYVMVVHLKMNVKKDKDDK